MSLKPLTGVPAFIGELKSKAEGEKSVKSAVSLCLLSVYFGLRHVLWDSQVVQVVKNLNANARDARDLGLIPGSGRSPEVGNGNPFQYFCLENPMDRGVWWATVHGVAKSRTQLNG